jgi:hypothetical protein
MDFKLRNMINMWEFNPKYEDIRYNAQARGCIMKTCSSLKSTILFSIME